MNVRIMVCLTACLVTGSAFAQMRQTVNVTVKVIDEQNQPITNAYVIGGGEGTEEYYASKKVNKAGLVEFKDVIRRQIAFAPEIVAPGYYASKGEFLPKIFSQDREYLVKLRKVINPVPIETREMDFLVGRKFDDDIGFDMEKLDWTTPHGAGMHTDLVVRARWERIQGDVRDMGLVNTGLRSIVTLRTVGAGNGFLPFEAEQVSSSTEPGSVFMLPYQVPVTGITNEIRIIWETYDNLNSTYTEKFKSHYAFRVRAHIDGNGVLVNSHVGWIQGQVSAAAAFFPEGSPNGPRPKPSEAVPDRFCLKFIRHWNPDPKSNSLEPNDPKLRWENEISQLIRRFKLQDMPWVKELQPLDRNDPQWIPSPEEVQAERKAKEEERMKAARAAARASREKHFREDPKAAERYFESHPEERALYDLEADGDRPPVRPPANADPPAPKGG